jgi:enoyl-CoA hydratase/carnithine racemase
VAYEEILYDVADAVATVTLNRPAKLNAWTSKMELEVEDAMLTAERDERVRVIVLTGAGRGFCAGADMANLDGLAKSTDADETLEHLRDRFAGPRIEGARADFQKTYSYLPAIGKSIIAAVNGPAAGLGFVISLYCDIRFASDQAKFTTAFARLGLIAEYGMAWMLPRLVGVSNALDLLYSARLVDANEALAMGLVSRVIPADIFAAEVRKYALELASASSPRSLRVIKRQIYEGLLTNLAEAIDLANEEMLQSLISQDFKEGTASFVEKRAPAFTGR